MNLRLNLFRPCQHGRLFLPDLRHPLPLYARAKNTPRPSFHIRCNGFEGESPAKSRDRRLRWLGRASERLVREEVFFSIFAVPSVLFGLMPLLLFRRPAHVPSAPNEPVTAHTQ